jgi:antitoxin component YwqK of YwqJK toxin-antitoxin module
MREFALFTSLFVWSFLFGKADKPIDYSLLEKREINGEEIYFLKDKEDPYTGKSVELRDNGKRIFISYSQGKWAGPAIEYYPNGNKSYQDLYENGKMVFAKSWKPDGSSCDVTQAIDGNGVVQTYHPNGKQEWRAFFKNGFEDGLGTWWYENGQKKVEVNYKDGKKDGLGTWWYENGEKQSESHWKEGKEEGAVTWWYDNGNKKEEGNWKDGKAHGAFIYYDKKGKETLRRNYLKGVITLEHKPR